MFTTLYTDASYRHGEIATWAVWLRSCRGRIIEGGLCPPEIQDNNEAELYALLMGVTICLEKWPNTKIIGCNSDSGVVCDLHVTKPNKRKGVELLKAAIKALPVEVRVKHVKAHQAPNDVRSYLNNQCDAIARRQYKASAPVARVRPNLKNTLIL